jgi:hypothetical protein
VAAAHEAANDVAADAAQADDPELHGAIFVART